MTGTGWPRPPVPLSGLRACVWAGETVTQPQGWVPLGRLWPAQQKCHQGRFAGSWPGTGWQLRGICLWEGGLEILKSQSSPAFSKCFPSTPASGFQASVGSCFLENGWCAALAHQTSSWHLSEVPLRKCLPTRASGSQPWLQVRITCELSNTPGLGCSLHQ